MGAAIAAITGAGIAGGITQGYYANKSRQATNKAYSNAFTQQQQGLGYLNPYMEAGNTALSPLTGLLTGNQYNPETGKSTPLSADQRNELLYISPGYQFALEQTQQSLDRSQAARGLSLSGGAQKELAQYTSGLASQNYNNYISQLQNLSGMGFSAAQNSADINSGLANLKLGQGLAGSNYYNQLGNIFGQTASQIGGGIFSSQIGNNNINNTNSNYSPLMSSGLSYLSPSTTLNSPII